MTKFTDSVGRSFKFATPPKRVISLVPSLTETLFDIGAGNEVIATTDFCIFPSANRPKLGGTKNPKVDQIKALNPDLVYVNLEENLAKHADAIAQFTTVFATHPKTVADVIDLIRLLGQIHNQTSNAETITTQIEKTAGYIGEPFTFAVPIWKDPWMWCGGDTYVSDLVCSAAGRNVLANETRYPQHSVDDVLALKPDVIFLPDEPYVFTVSDSSFIVHRSPFSVPRVVGPFPGHLFTWHGSRTLLGLQFLKQALAR